MNKLELADPLFTKMRATYPTPRVRSTNVSKPKKGNIRPEDLLALDMDDIDNELATLNLEDLDPRELDEKTIDMAFPAELVRRRKLAEKMPEPLYDEDGLPILPDGSSRPWTFQEMGKMYREYQTRLCKDKPKSKMQPKKVKLRKNPPPRKVDIEALFREEAKRQETLRQYD